MGLGPGVDSGDIAHPNSGNSSPFELIALRGRVVKTEMPGAQRCGAELKQASTPKDPLDAGVGLARTNLPVSVSRKRKVQSYFERKQATGC